MILTGGDAANSGVTEAEALQNLLQTLRVPSRLMLLEQRSVNTTQNAWEAVNFLPSGCTQVHLVTSDFHMPRATYIFEAVFAYLGVAASIQQHPSATPCSDLQARVADSDVGRATSAELNSVGVVDRIRWEKQFLLQKLPLRFNKEHIDGVVIPLLPESRLQKALLELDALLDEHGLVQNDNE
mmetsp:Transcript_83755/g.138490  ORF Transcript_83755/g.138490 Transcript_83755/m.138490 type:complete len:183 (+) Transcript_83755:245-793(+)